MTHAPQSDDPKISRVDFLRTIFGEVAAGECTTYTIAKPIQRENGTDDVIFLTYRLRPDATVPSSATHLCPFTLDDSKVMIGKGRIERTEANLRTVKAIIQDDVGKKAKALALKPSWSMETSPGSWQLGYIISDGPHPLQDIDNTLETLVKWEFTDPGASKLNQLFRLPGSKPAGKEYTALLRSWHPERVYTLAEINTAIGHTIEVRSRKGKRSDASLPDGTLIDDPFTEWVRSQDWYIGDLRAGGWESVECPWSHTHTTGTSGTDYNPPTAERPFRTFKCFHGHCQEAQAAAEAKAKAEGDKAGGHARDSVAFIAWCVERGAPDVGWHYEHETVRDLEADGAMMAALLAAPATAPKGVIAERLAAAMQAQRQVVAPAQARGTQAPAGGAQRKSYDVIDPADYPVIARQLGEALNDLDLGFLYGGVPVAMGRRQSAMAMVQVLDVAGRPVVDEMGDPVTKPAETLQPVPLTPSGLTALVDEVAYFEKIKETQNGYVYTPCDAPATLLGRMLSGVGGNALTATLRVARGVATHPIWFNGALQFGEGYHEASGIYLHTGTLVPEEFETAQAAWQYLRHDWLGDYPFASEVDAVVALTIPMTLLCAKSMLLNEAGPPAILISAPQAGTGKSYLAMQLMLAVTGELPAMSIYPDTEVERGKTITSTIMEGASYVLFDNIQTGAIIGNSHRKLTTLVTAPIWKDRILGVSATYAGPACLVPVLTGNNILAVEDMGRRALTCRLENAEGVHSANKAYRRRSPFKWTIAHRARILGAMATILKAGSKGVDVVGGFPRWSEMVAAPLIKASGVEGFFEPWVEAAESDMMGSATRGADVLIEKIAEMLTPDGKPQPTKGEWFTSDEIRIGAAQAVSDALGDEVRPTTEKVQHLLRRNLGVVVNGRFKLRGIKRSAGDRTNRKVVWMYRVERIDGSEAPMNDAKARDILRGNITQFPAKKDNPLK